MNRIQPDKLKTSITAALRDKCLTLTPGLPPRSGNGEKIMGKATQPSSSLTNGENSSFNNSS